MTNALMNGTKTPANLIVDGSAFTDLVVASLEKRFRLRKIIGSGNILAPRLLEFEYYSSLRNAQYGGTISEQRHTELLMEFFYADIEYCETRHLALDIMRLSQKISTYDASYVALAIERGHPLLTCDKKLSKGAKGECEIILVE